LVFHAKNPVLGVHHLRDLSPRSTFPRAASWAGVQKGPQDWLALLWHRPLAGIDQRFPSVFVAHAITEAQRPFGASGGQRQSSQRGQQGRPRHGFCSGRRLTLECWLIMLCGNRCSQSGSVEQSKGLLLACYIIIAKVQFQYETSVFSAMVTIMNEAAYHHNEAQTERAQTTT